MELMGVIYGLERLKTKSNVQVYTDSRYVVDGISKGWAERWRQNNWKRKKNKKALNGDLWERLLILLSEHNVNFNWVKGHAGHLENERCDHLANQGINSQELFNDDGYEPAKKVHDLVSNTEILKSKVKVIVEKEGDNCRKCNNPVIKKVPKKKKTKPNQKYYYEYYLFCPSCKTMYMVENGKREIQTENGLFE